MRVATNNRKRHKAALKKYSVHLIHPCSGAGGGGPRAGAVAQLSLPQPRLYCLFLLSASWHSSGRHAFQVGGRNWVKKVKGQKATGTPFKKLS